MTQPKSVFEVATSSGYNLNDDQVQELGHLHTASETVAGRVTEVYLRTLVHRVKQNTSVYGTALSALSVVESTMYDAVKRGALTSDIVVNPLVDSAEERSRKALEHNRRCNWARSIKSELKAALKAGIELETIDINTLTKSDLRTMRKVACEAAVVPSTAGAHASLALALFKRAFDQLDTAVIGGEDTSEVMSFLSTKAGCLK